jgi:hypothetical protein
MEPLPEPEVEAPPQRHARRGAVAGSDPFANLEDLTTVWIGGIPEAHPAMDELVLEDFFDRRFGHVDSLHLRVKAGTDRSWCLVSFAEEAPAQQVLDEGVDLGEAVGGGPKASCRVMVDRADILTHLRKPNPGALASVWVTMETKKRKMKTSRSSTPRRPGYYDSSDFQKLVDMFWSVMQEEAGAFSHAKPHAVGNRDTISYDMYESLHLRISKTLHTHFSRGIAKSVATQDWGHDTAAIVAGTGTGTMTRSQFEKSLGELGELWAGEVTGEPTAEGELDASWKTDDPTSVVVKFLSVLYENCTEQEDTAQQRKRLLKKRLLNVRFLSIKGLSDKMAEAEPVPSQTQTQTQNPPASLLAESSTDAGASSPISGWTQDDAGREAAARKAEDAAAAQRKPKKFTTAAPPLLATGNMNRRWDPALSCGCEPGLPMEYHCERCAYRAAVAADRQAKEQKERERLRYVRAAGGLEAVEEALDTGRGIREEHSTISVGECLSQLSWERSWSDLPETLVPSDCHKQGGFVRSSGTSQPGALAGAVPHAPGTTPLDDPLMMGSTSQDTIGAAAAAASSASVAEMEESMASLATSASVVSVTSVASAVLPCAHPQLHGRNARALQPLGVMEGPNLRPISMIAATARKAKPPAAPSAGGSTAAQKLRSSAARVLAGAGDVVAAEHLAAGLMRKAVVQERSGLDKLTINVMKSHHHATHGAADPTGEGIGWLPPYGFVVPRPPPPRKPPAPKIGAGIVASRTGLSRLSTPRAAARDALHAPLPTLTATLSMRRPSRASVSAREPVRRVGVGVGGGGSSSSRSGYKLPARPVPGPTRQYVTSTADIHPSVDHPVHRRLCPPGKNVAATVREASRLRSRGQQAGDGSSPGGGSGLGGGKWGKGGGTAHWWAAGGTITDAPMLNPPPFLASLRGGQF